MTSWITYPSLRACAARTARMVAIAAALVAAPAVAQTDPRPLSPAQIALFQTPHLDNIAHPETLEYRYQRSGAGAFTDSILERIEKIHPDGTKYVGFTFLTGEHHVFFPAVDNFHGNPLLMLFLEHDVREMRAATGLAAAYYRNRIREAFVDQAKMSDTEVMVDGKSVPARRITLQPFASDPRFKDDPAVRDKTYTFVLAAQVPGMIEELGAEAPGNPADGTPSLVERITFAAEKPLGEQP